MCLGDDIIIVLIICLSLLLILAYSYSINYKLEFFLTCCVRCFELCFLTGWIFLDLPTFSINFKCHVCCFCDQTRTEERFQTFFQWPVNTWWIQHKYTQYNVVWHMEELTLAFQHCGRDHKVLSSHTLVCYIMRAVINNHTKCVFVNVLCLRPEPLGWRAAWLRAPFMPLWFLVICLHHGPVHQAEIELQPSSTT